MKRVLIFLSLLSIFALFIAAIVYLPGRVVANIIGGGIVLLIAALMWEIAGAWAD
jgi:F0F1-type ATP synthase membrane subunit a